MSNVPESEWTTVSRESVPLVRWWRTTAAWWQQDRDGGEEYVRLQRHRLMPWRSRRRVVSYGDREVTA